MKRHNKELWDALCPPDRRAGNRLWSDVKSATVTALGIFVFVFIAWMVAAALAS